MDLGKAPEAGTIRLVTTLTSRSRRQRSCGTTSSTVSHRSRNWSRSAESSHRSTRPARIVQSSNIRRRGSDAHPRDPEGGRALWRAPREGVLLALIVGSRVVGGLLEQIVIPKQSAAHEAARGPTGSRIRRTSSATRTDYLALMRFPIHRLRGRIAPANRHLGLTGRLPNSRSRRPRWCW
jgi:hypothetical protein